MIALNPNFTANTVAVVLQDTGFPNDYTVSGGLLTVNVPVLPSDDLVVTLFSNAGTMGIRTTVYVTDATSYPLSTPMLPLDRQYTLVAMNGLTLVPDLDYQVRYLDDGTGWFDLLTRPTQGYLIITSFTGHLAHTTQQWLNVSRTPAVTRMPPVLDALGEPVTDDSGVPLHHVLDERLSVSPEMAGKMSAALTPDVTQISIVLFLRTISPKLLPPIPLDIPDESPGVIWIGSERIEYFRLSRVDDVVTLRGLRRATQGKSITEQRQVITRTGDGRSHNYTLNGVGGRRSDGG